MSDEQRINGNMYSWSSIFFKVEGERYYGIKSIGYGDSRERVKGYGMGRSHAPRGRSAGKYQPDPVTVTLEKETARALREKLAASASDGRSFGNVEFEVVVQYEESDKQITDEIFGCVWTKTAAKGEESADPLYEEVEFDCMGIRWDGDKTLFDSSEVGG